MSEFELSTDELIRWLDKKYSRHGEIEDGLAAERLRSLSCEGELIKQAARQVCECMTQDSLMGCIEVLRGLVRVSEGLAPDDEMISWEEGGIKSVTFEGKKYDAD